MNFDISSITPPNIPVEWLKKQHFHLKDLPLPLINKAHPLVLIASDHAELLVPISPVRMGPVVVNTALG